MWKRNELKSNAKAVLKRNYWSCIIMCVLVTVIMGSFTNPVFKFEQAVNSYQAVQQGDTSIIEQSEKNISGNDNSEKRGRQDVTSNTEIVDSFLGGVGMQDDYAKHWTNGVLSVVANNAAGAGNVLYGIMNTINQMIFQDRIGASVIIAIGVLLSVVILLFLKNVIKVGYCRYFLETRIYSKTHVNKVLFPWHVKRGFKVAWIMIVKTVYMILWSCTIIGGVIKYYSYRMVPYIVAENPNIDANEAITLSRKMMEGHKWKAFVLDISFLPWLVLNVITFELLNIFFLRPYIETTNAELYTSLKNLAKSKEIQKAEKLCDIYLDVEVQNEIYPIEKYIIPPVKGRQWAHADYNRNYSVMTIILIFFTFSFIGWVWEVSLHLFKDGVFVNRGVSYGPWLPIYGTGGVIVIVALKKLRNNPVLTFMGTMVLCGIVEYSTSWFLEMTNGMKWWDYSGYFMNLNGRICLEGLIVFAAGGCAAIYLFAPMLDNVFKKIPKNIKIAICTVLLASFCADQIYSHFKPNCGKGITDYGTSASLIKYKVKTTLSHISL